MSNSYVAIKELHIVKWQQDYVNSDSKQYITLLYKDVYINSKVANQGYNLGPDQNRLQLGQYPVIFTIQFWLQWIWAGFVPVSITSSSIKFLWLLHAEVADSYSIWHYITLHC